MTFKEWLRTQPSEVEFDLISKEEDHAIYTVVDNPLTASEDFIQAFHKMFEAEVEIEDIGGITVVFIDAPAKRTLSFQKILAGHEIFKFTRNSFPKRGDK